MEQAGENVSEQRPWGDLCSDILLGILSFLPFMDHLSFRAVCTLWRAAARKALAEEQPQDQPPWLMFTTEGSDANKKQLLDHRNRKIYTMEWPEMEGARCVASKHGWLLYHSPLDSRVFFFNPFSKATIELPYIESLWPASFDGHPTKDDCVIIGIYKCLPNEVIICYCGRGDDYWTLSRCKTFWQWDSFTHAASCNHQFCFMDAKGKLFVFNFLFFSIMECRGPPLNFDSYRVAYLLSSHWRVFAGFVNVDTGSVSVFVMREGQWHWLMGALRGEIFYLGRTASLAFVSTPDERNVLYFDALVADGSSCPEYRMGQDRSLTDFGGFENSSCKDAMWIEPRWIEPSPLHNWLLVRYKFGHEAAENIKHDEDENDDVDEGDEDENDDDNEKDDEDEGDEDENDDDNEKDDEDEGDEDENDDEDEEK